MPNWLLPLICLIVLGGFLYFGFWRGLSNKRDENNRDTASLSDPGSSGGHT